MYEQKQKTYNNGNLNSIKPTGLLTFVLEKNESISNCELIT